MRRLDPLIDRPLRWSQPHALRMGYELRDGRRFRADNNLWMTKFAFRTESDAPLVRFESIGGVFRHHATMEILPSLRVERAPLWLPVFGWHLRILMGRDTAAAT
jgi:hypothetical protein